MKTLLGSDFFLTSLLSLAFAYNSQAAYLDGPAARTLYFSIGNPASNSENGAIAEKSAVVLCLEQQKGHGKFQYQCMVNERNTGIDTGNAEKIYQAIPEQTASVKEAGIFQKEGTAKCIETTARSASVYKCRIE